MAHPRKLIRDAVVERLKAASTSADSRVFANRALPLFKNELPAILVYLSSEPSEISIEAPREYRRNLQLTLELVAQNNSEGGLDDALDELAEQVERVMFEDETFGGLVSDTILGETTAEIIEEGEKPVGAVKISFSMPYFQQIPAEPTYPLDPFKTANTKIDMAPKDGVNNSEDSQTLPQV